MSKFICIHGHFYQPPRENPWLEEVEIQDSAYPYHDWNERITAECYAPNSAARVLDSERRIIDIINNYSKISFNFGPTLLSWLEKHNQSVYQAVIEADEDSRKAYSGHGSALAQPYNHMILPLANTRDKRTQITWGIQDFECRFKRKPEGMWLPETAVDSETLRILAEMGIKFAVLGPNQAARIRRIGDDEWEDVSGGRIDPKRPYLYRISEGQEINLFFYNSPISNDIAFGDILKSGEKLAKQLTSAFSDKTDIPQIVSIASDGETYGHHNRFGDMALAYCLYLIESDPCVKITVYGEFLENYPPTHEVQIIENSSWSCTHGVERWRSDCGCHTGLNPGWSQQWRGPLREAMDWLSDKLSFLYEQEMSLIMPDAWEVRDDYITVLLDRSKDRVESFFTEHEDRELSEEEKRKSLKLLEMQRCALLMYTSCGWFFDDISRIETVQVMQYAARAIQLARSLTGRDLEPGYTDILGRALGNTPEYQNGSDVYAKLVKPAVMDLVRVGVHYAVSSLFEDYAEVVSIGAYTAASKQYDLLEAGRQRLAVGRVLLRSDVTWDEGDITFAILHLGDHNLIGGAREYRGEESFNLMKNEIISTFNRSDLASMVDLLDEHFGTHNYSLWHLFRDEKRKVLNQVIETTLKELEKSYQAIYENHYPVLQALRDMKIPIPQALAMPVSFVLNADLQRLLKEKEPDLEKIKKTAVELRQNSLYPDKACLSYTASKKINELIKSLSIDPENLELIEKITDLLQVLSLLDLELDLWKSQNHYFFLTRNLRFEMKGRMSKGGREAEKWLELIQVLGNFLGVKTI
ncbi:MAG: DUF3536 domain-containing protein [Candidatus Aminicenantes bacterium]|nr:DUF3536 domain-containing protein [Candidatus Aminicenantes bacterium]